MRAAVFVALCLLMAAPFARAQGDLIETRESVYNNIFIRERGDLVIMQFGKNKRFWTESVYDRRDDRALPVAYTRFLTTALAYPADTKSVLEIGLGGGRTAAYLNLHMPDLDILSVELDPDVIELAKKHFALKPSDKFQIIAQDGRIHMVRDRKKHDVIMVDAYRGPFVPFHLLTREFYLTAKRRLNPGGVLAQNIEPTTMLFDSAIKTLTSVFDHVEVYDASGNVVAIAYDGEQIDQAALQARAGDLQAKHDFKYPLPEMLVARRIVTTPPDVKPLVDDFAPVEMLKSIERHNQGVDSISKPVAQ
ncbi:MAG: fused MFS/spermidine synthase [Pseudomonadota bacterium]